MSNYILHYGIKGQQHGKRRFQNEDGSLTEAGKLRYGVGNKLQKGAQEASADLEIAGAMAGVEAAKAKYAVKDAKRDVVDAALTKKEEALGQSSLRRAKRVAKNKVAEVGDIANIGKAYLKLGKAVMKKELKNISFGKSSSNKSQSTNVRKGRSKDSDGQVISYGHPGDHKTTYHYRAYNNYILGK